MIYPIDLEEGDKIILTNPKGYIENADFPNYNRVFAGDFERVGYATVRLPPVNKERGVNFEVSGRIGFIPYWECQFFSRKG